MQYEWTDHQLFRHHDRAILFGVDQGSLFFIDEATRELVERLDGMHPLRLEEQSAADRDILESLAEARFLAPLGARHRIEPAIPDVGSIPLTTMVLEVAQECNLSCRYCYAEGGTYGKQVRHLSPSLARDAVRQLVAGSGDRQTVTLVIFGGEPLLNMDAVRAAVEEAGAATVATGKRVFISLTTNATLLTPEIIDFIHQHRIAVAVSLDGPADLHDANRPDAAGNGSYGRIAPKLGDLLRGATAAVAARVTLIPEQWSRVEEVFYHLMGLGFHEVGIGPVSPVRPEYLPDTDQEEQLLAGFAALTTTFVKAARQGKLLPFSNIIDLLARLHLGQTKSVSCGAGMGYLAVDAEGKYYLCHRLVGEESFCVGDIATGHDPEEIRRAIDGVTCGKEEMCGQCWARTLCAGGCHYENHLRENLLGIPPGSSCSFIRRWFQLGIEAYAELKLGGADELLRRLEKRVKC
jgi:uncharacterized protein